HMSAVDTHRAAVESGCDWTLVRYRDRTCIVPRARERHEFEFCDAHGPAKLVCLFDRTAYRDLSICSCIKRGRLAGRWAQQRLDSGPCNIVESKFSRQRIVAAQLSVPAPANRRLREIRIECET